MGVQKGVQMGSRWGPGGVQMGDPKVGVHVSYRPPFYKENPQFTGM